MCTDLRLIVELADMTCPRLVFKCRQLVCKQNHTIHEYCRIFEEHCTKNRFINKEQSINRNVCTQYCKESFFHTRPCAYIKPTRTTQSRVSHTLNLLNKNKINQVLASAPLPPFNSKRTPTLPV